MPLSTSIRSVLFFCQFQGKKKEGGGNSPFQIVEIGDDLDVILSCPNGAGFPIWVLIRLVGDL